MTNATIQHKLAQALILFNTLPKKNKKTKRKFSGKRYLTTKSI